MKNFVKRFKPSQLAIRQKVLFECFSTLCFRQDLKHLKKKIGTALVVTLATDSFQEGRNLLTQNLTIIIIKNFNDF